MGSLLPYHAVLTRDILLEERISRDASAAKPGKLRELRIAASLDNILLRDI